VLHPVSGHSADDLRGGNGDNIAADTDAQDDYATACRIADVHRPDANADERGVQWCASANHRSRLVAFPCREARWADAVLSRGGETDYASHSVVVGSDDNPHSRSGLCGIQGLMVRSMSDHLERANPARIYDFLLGGSLNFEADRVVGAELARLVPGAAGNAVANRRFVGRAVRWLLDAGVRQFLDLGSGLPTVGNVHEVAQSVDPAARVVYVDCDPVVAEQSWRVLADNLWADVVYADLREPETVLASPEVERLLNLSEPVGLLACCALHFVPDVDDPAGVLHAYTKEMAAGSHLVVSQVTAAHATPDQSADAAAVYDAAGAPVTARTPARITALFDGFELLDPGVVPVDRWRPEGDAPDGSGSDVYGGIGELTERYLPTPMDGYAGISVTHGQYRSCRVDEGPLSERRW
jgi:hypothetical protein